MMLLMVFLIRLGHLLLVLFISLVALFLLLAVFFIVLMVMMVVVVRLVIVEIIPERMLHSAVTMNGAASRKRSSAAEADDTHARKPRHGLAAQTV